MNIKLSFVAVAGAALFASSSHAALLSGFESGIDGWAGTATATLAQSTVGATQGTKSLAITYSGFN